MTAAILLAAGASRRFGAQNKLLAAFRGRPLVTHAAEALRASGLAPLIAVTTSPDVAALLPGFHLVSPDRPDPEQSDSLRAGVAEARRLGAPSALVALADMPGVTPDLLRTVAARATATEAAAASDGLRALPPACFPAALFDALLGATGDRGARPLLAGLPPAQHVPAPPEALRDIDTPGDLAAQA
ncbi:NTP transferase domain-containing protein [Rhodovulum sp. 12E13]|uniref:nucleotidyltransferase family protein n=1 Tax=Rhodovulum sp. 12E13 TaxID=2203891 RepID=UPI001314AEA2|nr:nucleotidyltransferase family protein [Rhodovulum sp. 12E13]